MQSCSNSDCETTFGHDAGWDDPPEEGDGHIAVAFNPTDDPVVLSETRYYCSISCLQTDADEVPGGLLDGDSRCAMSSEQKLPGEAITDAAEDFQDRKLGGMMLSGRCGFHTFYEWDNDDPTTSLDTALHMALDDLLEQIWVEADEVEMRHGEATAETVAKETLEQMEDLTGLFGDPWAAESFEETLAEKLRLLNTYPDAAGAEDGGSR